MASAVRRGIISGSIGLFSRIAIQLCLLTVTIFSTRVLSIANFGAYAIVSSLMVLARLLFYVGPYEYLLKTEDRSDLKGSCFIANMILALFSAFGLGIFTLFATRLFGNPDIARLTYYLIPSVPLAAITAWYEAILLRNLAIRRYYMFSVFGEVVSVVVAILLLFHHYGIFSLGSQIYVRVVVLLILYVFATREKSWRYFNAAEVKSILHWSWSRYVAVFLNFSANSGADFILGHFLSPFATGIYRASNRIVSALTDMFAQPLQKIVQTNVSAQFARGGKPNASWLGMFTSVAAIGWAALAGLAYGADIVVPLVLGEKWRVAVPVVRIFCLIRALGLLDATTTSLLVCCDRQRFMLNVQIIVGIAVPIFSWGLSLYGLVAVAIANGCIMAGLTFMYCREAIRLSDVVLKTFMHSLAIALTPALGVGLAIFILGPFEAKPEHFMFISGHWYPMVRIIVICAIGFTLGMAFVRRQFLASVQSLGAT